MHCISDWKQGGSTGKQGNKQQENMSSKTIATYSKGSDNKGTCKRKGISQVFTESKLGIGSSLEVESKDDLNSIAEKTESEEGDVSEMDEEDQGKVNNDKQDQHGSSMDEEEAKDEDRRSDSSDEDKITDECSSMDDVGGVEFSDSEDNDSGAEGNENVDGEESSDIKVAANPAWAQAMAKILRTQKPSNKKAVALSKARTIQAAESATSQKLKEQPDFEIVGEKEVKPPIKIEDVKPSAEELLQVKRERLAQSRVKQEDFDYNRERALTKIATKGVVQLFNAVRSQQKNLGSKLAEAHSTRMEERLLKSIDKDSFLEHLTGKIRSRPVEEVGKKIKKEGGEIVLPKSWDELSKKVDLKSWDKVTEIKDEPED